jgi:hypothetical protein
MSEKVIALPAHAPSGTYRGAVFDEPLVLRMESFMKRRVGSVSSVSHEFESEIVHIDVHEIPPRLARPSWVLFTTGMSGLPMTPSHTAKADPADRVELVMGLPGNWDEGELVVCGRQVTPDVPGWPIRLLRHLARYPHRGHACVDEGHIYSRESHTRLTPGLPFTGVIFLPPLGVLKPPWTIRVKDGRRIKVLAPFPLHADEVDLASQDGADSLRSLLERFGVSAVLDPHRASVVR